MYRSNGKLLLTGEYLVLYGARALVLPLKTGQEMQVLPVQQGNRINWKSSVMNRPWFTMALDTGNWTVSETSDEKISRKLVLLLKEALKMNPQLFEAFSGFDISTNTEFNIEWGFGSSAALVANIAGWAMVDPFQLQFRTFGGSGADVAGALSDGPVLYRLINGKPSHCRIVFHPPYHEKLWFVYLGKKVDTVTGISGWNTPGKVDQKNITLIDDLTLRITEANSVEVFMDLVGQHEHILSGLLQTPPVKELLFPDFAGQVKSLGTWGGDFVLAVSEESEASVREYFNSKALDPVFQYDQIVR